MPKVLKAQIRSFLHDYKKRVFEIEHDPKLVEQRKSQVHKVVAQILDEKSRFHLHQKVDATNAATLDLIYDFCHEALLPPVVGKIADRILSLEARQAACLEMVHKMLDAFAADETA
ncbi:MAG TPA: hypothetical protein VFG37_03995 [Planctomycetota bacterium]|jgi:hypothetical protein|nr:hypothetical protein [Planctomycetota bacterium]